MKPPMFKGDSIMLAPNSFNKKLYTYFHHLPNHAKDITSKTLFQSLLDDLTTKEFDTRYMIPLANDHVVHIENAGKGNYISKDTKVFKWTYRYVR